METTKKRGFAFFIVNINDRSTQSSTGSTFAERLGAQNDPPNLDMTFGMQGMGFDWVNQHPDWHMDLTVDKWDHTLGASNGNQVDKSKCCLKCHIQSLDHSDCEYFLLAISSHGKEITEPEVIFSDNKSVYLSEIIAAISDTNCPTLAGKPRIIILQVCRVTSTDASLKLWRFTVYCLYRSTL